MATRTLINNRAVMNNDSPLASILNLHRLSDFSLNNAEKIPIDVRYQPVPSNNVSEAESLLDIFTTNNQYVIVGYAFGDNLYVLLYNTDLSSFEWHLYNSETGTIGEVVPGIVECEAPVRSSNSSCSFYIVTDTDNDIKDYISMYVGVSFDNDSPRIVAQFQDWSDQFDTSETNTPPGGDVVQ